MDSLQEQIKVNAGLTLNTRPLGATEGFSEIGSMTADLAATEGEEKNPTDPSGGPGIPSKRFSSVTTE
ncbi:hypothetical protein D0860_08539 [Hortaea werneckii]|uniref:Uncharacterized protein n=1 Tax=Hortaea werneckii TaxID=91943 RepID=A0A3M7GAX9_HORWE|nr:hypothetical protein D0860_08539 [Hortaea werneckii]RMZ20986.1 hypothetical protein D0859_15001 [Hortaea werneckii]